MPFTRVTVQEQYETSTGGPASGSVEFTPVDQMHNGSLVISAPQADALENGVLSINLAATTDPATRPVGVTYRVIERILGQPVRTYYVAVPHDQGSTLQLADLPSYGGEGSAGFALRNAVDYDDSTPPTDGQAMVWDSTTSKFHPESVSGVGSTVTSVNGQTGAVTVSPASINAQPADSDLTTIAALAPTDGSLLERVAGSWTARNPTQVKGDLGLDQVNNTADLAKPLSTAATAALAAKAPLDSPAFTGTPTAPRFVGAVATVTYAAGVTLNAQVASTFQVAATGDITSVTISGGFNGQSVRLQVFASGADRTVTAFGQVTLVPSGTWGSIGWTYNQSSNVWIQDRSSVSGGSGGAVSSVNGQTGAVSITTTSLGAQPVDSDLTTIAALGPTDGSLLSRQGGVWTGRTVAQTKLDMALDQVDNTTDANKPISNAVAASLAAKASLVSPALTNPTANRFLGAVQVVTYAASVTFDASAATTFRVIATGPLTVADITNGANGQQVALEVLASGADRTVTVAGTPITVAAGLWWIGTLRYDSVVDSWKLTESNGGTTGGSGGVPDDGSVTNAKVATNAGVDLSKTADSVASGGRLAMTSAERTKLAALDPSTPPGSYTDEQVRDVVGATLLAGSNVTITPDDAGDTITIAAAAPAYTDEQVRDVVGATLLAGSNVTITPNDGADTITISAAVTGGAAQDGIYLDSFTGTDDTRLTSAIAAQQATAGMPPIILGARNHSFNQIRTIYSGLKLVGSNYSGQKNLELSSANFVTSRVTLGSSISSGTSSWWNSPGTDCYDVFMADFGVSGSAGSSIHQFLDFPATATLYSCEFRSLSFNFMRSVFGRKDRVCAITGVVFSGCWTANNLWDTQFNLGGSDSSLWMSGWLNIGPSQSPAQTGTYADADYELMFSSLSKTNVGYIFMTALNGWRGIRITGSSGNGLQFFGGVYEGYKGNTTSLTGGPAPGTVIRIEGGSGSFHSPSIGQAMNNPDVAEGGYVHMTGGEWAFYSPTFYRGLLSETVPVIFQTGGRLMVQGATRWQNETWTDRPRVSTTATGPNSTQTSFYCPDQSLVTV